MTLITAFDSIRVTTHSASRLGGLAALLLFIYTIYGAIYRIYLSPLSHVPGPFLARLTFWNQFYYDVVLGGKYGFVIKDYHKKYGAVIRINPYEVHISDPDFYEQLYVGAAKGKVDKWYWSMRMFGRADVQASTTTDHDQHRIRREPWNPFFSKASVSKLHPLLIQDCVNKLCDRLADFQANRKPVVMTYAYACLTADVISEYSFPEGHGSLNWRPNFSFRKDNYDQFVALGQMTPIFRHVGWIYPLLDSLPLWCVKLISPEAHQVVREQQVLVEQAKEIKSRLDENKASDSKDATGRPSMLETFLTSSTLPPHEKSPEHIGGEAYGAMGAGTTTSVHTLRDATYHILANPPILSRLLTELESAIPDLNNHPPDLRKLESIDYLVAIMYEALRISTPIPHRSARIFRGRSIVYGEGTLNEVVIPPDTPISMTSIHVHYDEKIFPNPRDFNPERWLPLKTNGLRLQKYQVAFGKGTRSCVGMELAKAEILTVLANVFLRFGTSMKLVDCVRERDIDLVHDSFIAETSRQCNGLVVSFH